MTETKVKTLRELEQEKIALKALTEKEVMFEAFNALTEQGFASITDDYLVFESVLGFKVSVRLGSLCTIDYDYANPENGEWLSEDGFTCEDDITRTVKLADIVEESILLVKNFIGGVYPDQDGCLTCG